MEERKESAKKIEEVLKEEQERAKVVYVNKAEYINGTNLKGRNTIGDKLLQHVVVTNDFVCTV